MLSSMKTNLRQNPLVGWSARFGIAALAVAFAATGFAAPSSGSKAKKRTVRTKPLRDCYVMLSASPFPQPLERLGSTPSTASPMTIIGEAPVIRCRR